MKIFLDPHAPNTNFILGAALSGGDPIAAAQMLMPSPHKESMPTTFGLEFRGQDMTVVVDQYDVDYDTNSLEVEWHFQGVTPEQHEALHVTDKEEEQIIERIGAHLGEYEDPDDDNWRDE